MLPAQIEQCDGVLLCDMCAVDLAKVADDAEIMAWWEDIQKEGHPDKKEGWPELNTVADLTDILTTIAYNGSAHHAAVNFGASPRA